MSCRCRISVIIPTHQRCTLVQRALQALARQSFSPDAYEVIVCIDGSEDDTQDVLSRFTSPYKLYIVSQPNLGRAAACNAGVRLAKGDLLVFLDDDMEPVHGFLAAHHQAHASHSQLGILGAVPISLGQSSPRVVKFIGSKFNNHLENVGRPGYRFKLRDFYSGNFSIHRDTFLRVGAFDESFKIYGNEDLELFVRLSKAGVQLKYCHEALARQNYTKDFAALARDNIAKGRTAVLLATKHPNTFHDLKLSTYKEGSPLWRLLRAGLLELGKLTSGENGMILLTTWLERRPLSRLDSFYRLALDYFYWLGAKVELRDIHETDLRHNSLAKAGRACQP